MPLKSWETTVMALLDHSNWTLSSIPSSLISLDTLFNYKNSDILDEYTLAKMI